MVQTSMATTPYGVETDSQLTIAMCNLTRPWTLIGIGGYWPML